MTAVEPRPAATVMLLRDAEPEEPEMSGLEVLMLRRSVDAPFVPGVYVFPGGAVEDSDVEQHRILAGLDSLEADRILGTTSGGIAFWVAAVRECLEETGILIAEDSTGRPVDATHPALADIATLRVEVEEGRKSLADVYEEFGLHVPLDRIAHVSRWITPESSPRRYDTHFFVTAMPPGQRSVADGWEAVESSWWSPATALSDWQAGNIDMIQPTVESLRLLAQHDTAASVIDTCQRSTAHPTDGVY